MYICVGKVGVGEGGDGGRGELVTTKINHHYSFTSRGKYSKSIAERYIEAGVLYYHTQAVK